MATAKLAEISHRHSTSINFRDWAWPGFSGLGLTGLQRWAARSAQR